MVSHCVGRLRNVTGPQPTYHACMGAPVALLQNLHFWSAGSDANCDLAFSLDLRFGVQVIPCSKSPGVKNDPPSDGVSEDGHMPLLSTPSRPIRPEATFGLFTGRPPGYLKSSLPAELPIWSTFTLTCNREAKKLISVGWAAGDEQEGCCCSAHPIHPTRSNY